MIIINIVSIVIGILVVAIDIGLSLYQIKIEEYTYASDDKSEFSQKVFVIVIAILKGLVIGAVIWFVSVFVYTIYDVIKEYEENMPIKRVVVTNIQTNDVLLDKTGKCSARKSLNGWLFVTCVQLDSEDEEYKFLLHDDLEVTETLILKEQ